MQNDISVVYYTSNFLDLENPTFLDNTRKQLSLAVKNLPLIVVSFKPVPKKMFPGYEGEYTNLVAGVDFEPYKKGRHHFNIYYQIMIGARYAKTKWVAMAEDDILYSYDHFHSAQFERDKRNGDMMYYDMNKVSLFTWTKPPMFSFRTKRMVVNQLIAPAKMLNNAMYERFERLKVLLKMGWTEDKVMKFWGDPGRYESHLGVTEQPTFQFYSNTPSIVFTHPKAYGYLNHGTRKRLGDIRIIELADWGRAEDILKLWGNHPTR